MGFFKRKWKNLVNKIGKGTKEASSLMHLIKMSEEEMELYSNYVSACMELRDLKQEESDELDELENLKVDEQIHQETVEDLKSKKLEILSPTTNTIHSLPVLSITSFISRQSFR